MSSRQVDPAQGRSNATSVACLHCDDGTLSRHLVYEHPSCGCVRPEAEFVRGHGTSCPKCRTSIAFSALTLVGGLYVCGECHHRADDHLLVRQERAE